MADADDGAGELTDEELTVLALAADPDTVVPGDAVSVWELFGDRPDPSLPEWYMPPPAGGVAHGRRWKRFVSGGRCW